VVIYGSLASLGERVRVRGCGVPTKTGLSIESSHPLTLAVLDLSPKGGR